MSQSNGHNNRKLFESSKPKPLTNEERYPDQLTPAQERFATEFLIDLNPRKAAERAGLNPNQGQGLLRKPHVWKFIRKKLEKLHRKTELTTENVLRELAALTFSSIQDYVNEDGSTKKPHELSEQAAAAIQSIEVSEEWEGTGEHREFKGYKYKYNQWSKTAAINNAMKYLGMLVDRVEGNIQHQHTHAHVAITPEELSAIPIDVRRKMLERMRTPQAPQITHNPETEAPPDLPSEELPGDPIS